VSFSTVVAFAGPHPCAPEVLEVASAITTPFGRLIALATPATASREAVYALAGAGKPPADPDLQAALQRYETATAKRGAHRAWVVATGDAEAALIEASLATDLLVLPNGATPELDVQRVVAASAAPVLLVPRKYPQPVHYRNVLIGWDGSRSVARAVRDALPLLRNAAEVAVMHVCEPNEKVDVRAATDAAVRWLADHGVEAYGCEMAYGPEGVCGTLFETAVERSADLVVAGAYGRDWVPTWYGGISARLVSDTPIACLVSH
jgi:nucleotide-binding universal stress UspA family protein